MDGASLNVAPGNHSIATVWYSTHTDFVFISAFDSRYTFPALGLGTVSTAIRIRTVASLTKRIRLWTAALAAGLGYVTKTVLFSFYR